MRQLRLVGLDEDGAHVVLESPTGDTFRLPVDDRLQAACRGHLSRLGQIELELERGLRPAEIQARVRGGESVEEVAATAGMPVERVHRFAYPVLQERQRVVAQAKATRVRRGAGPQTLDELVDERLIQRGTNDAGVSWDAWRREDGGWTVELRWRGTKEHSASWTYDLARRVLHADDPAAEQLIAEEFQLRTITPVTQLAAAAQESAQHAERAGREAAGGVAAGGSTVPLLRDPSPAQAGGEDDDERGRRPSVPSWDDILLGVRRRR
jgi:Protein of unknown function (DUF3071)